MCYKHSKNDGFRDILLSPCIHAFGVPGDGFRSFLETWGIILVVFGPPGILVHFRPSPGAPQVEVTQSGGG